MVFKSLSMTNLWDENYMVLDTGYKKSNINDSLASALQEYVASTIGGGMSNISGNNIDDETEDLIGSEKTENNLESVSFAFPSR